MRALRGIKQFRAALQAAAPCGCAAAAVRQPLQAATIATLQQARSWAQGVTPTSQGRWPQHVCQFSDVPASSAAQGELPEGYFDKIVDETLNDLLERIEGFVEDLDLEEADVEYSQGVLTVALGDLGTYVINKQTPNRQIWMSSPVSGPMRYDWAPGKWVYHRDGHDLHTRLSSELKQLTGQELDLSPCFSCGKLNVCQGDDCGTRPAS